MMVCDDVIFLVGGRVGLVFERLRDFDAEGVVGRKESERK